MSGYGTMTLPSGEKYIGEWSGGKRNGKGVNIWPSGERYEGEFINDKRNGKGVNIWPNGQKYEGEFKDNKKNGHGILAFPSGERYEGEFKDDLLHGQGTRTLPTGEKYVQIWENNKFVKQDLRSNKEVHSESVCIEGNCVSGYGTMTLPSGERYEGEFKDGKRSGKGTNRWPSGQRYEGEWKDDKTNGFGIYTKPSGERYEGQVKDGLFHGNGITTRPTGEKYVQIWENSHLIKEDILTSDKEVHSEQTYTFYPPVISYSYNIYDTNSNNVFDGGEEIRIVVRIKNDGKGEASNVLVLLEGYEFLVKLLGEKKDLGNLSPGEEKVAVFTAYLPSEIDSNSAKLSIKVKEGRGYSPTEIKSFQVAMKSAEIKETSQIISKLIDVDIVPSKTKNYSRNNSYAVVIGISHYRDEIIPEVKYARADAEAVAKYIENIGGIPRQNIKLLTDNMAAFSDLTSYLEEWLQRRVKKDSEVFMYYAGHGTPDPATNEAYIVPYDGHPDFKSKLYPLKRMYESLNKLPAEQVVVMLDSCFSGAEGRSVTRVGARPISISIENPVLAGGKIAVLAASTGSQISSDYDKVKHGLFTYYLLKGMKGDADENKDNTVELRELYNYIKSNVSETASVELNRDQTPVLLPDINENGHGKIEITRVK